MLASGLLLLFIPAKLSVAPDLPTAFAVARQSNKLVVMLASNPNSTGGNPWTNLENEPALTRALQPFVLVLVNDARASTAMDANAALIPLLSVMDGQGKVILRTGGYQWPSAFVQDLEVAQSLKSETRSAETARSLGWQGFPDDAVQRLGDRPTANDFQAVAEGYYALERYDEAMQFFAKTAAASSEPVQRSKALFRELVCEVRIGRKIDFRDALKAFAKSKDFDPSAKTFIGGIVFASQGRH